MRNLAAFKERFCNIGEIDVVLRSQPSELIARGAHIVIEDFETGPCEAPGYFCYVFISFTARDLIDKLLALGETHFKDKGSDGNGHRVLYANGSKENVFSTIRRAFL